MNAAFQLLVSGALAVACLLAQPAQASAPVFDCRQWGMRHDAPALLDRILARPGARDSRAELRAYSRSLCEGGIRRDVMTIVHHSRGVIVPCVAGRVSTIDVRD
jgi:hypothetical protein